MTSWTTPRTWITGEVLSSSNMNTHIRDNLAFYGGTDALNTTPPASPGNGQKWVLPVDTTLGVFWNFMYYTTLSAWVFQGGPPLEVDVATASLAVGTGYTALAGLALTVPRAGVYYVIYQGGYAVAGGQQGNASIKWGAAAAADSDSLAVGQVALVFNGVSGERRFRQTLAASDVVQVVGKASPAQNMSVDKAALTILPRRVT